MGHGAFFIETHGCQMNVCDSRFIADLLCRRGFRPAPHPEKADLILINTCSVRDRAERKALSRLAQLSALRRRRPRLVIGVVGCMAQRLGLAICQSKHRVDFIVGPDRYLELGDIISQADGAPSPVIDISQNPARWYRFRPLSHDAVSAFVTIMRGCDNFCSYCVVPYVRGRERSKPHGEVLGEIRHLVDLGVREVTLLGQNVNSYRDGQVDFSGLLELANNVEGLERIRFTTSHPKDLSPGVIACLADLPKVCEHLHLPLQSGSDRILTLMNRRYTYGRFKQLAQLARTKVPGLVLTTDLMVGFPTETWADHQATLRAMEELGFEGAFMFRYSPRPGTRAAQLEDDVPLAEKTSRLNQVIALQNRLTDAAKQALLGREVEVLVEGRSSREPGMFTGRTRKNYLAKLPQKGVSKGEVVRARVTGVSRWMITCDAAVRKAGR